MKSTSGLDVGKAESALNKTITANYECRFGVISMERNWLTDYILLTSLGTNGAPVARANDPARARSLNSLTHIHYHKQITPTDVSSANEQDMIQSTWKKYATSSGPDYQEMKQRFTILY